MLRSSFFLFAIIVIAFSGCGSDEVQLPLSASDGSPTILAQEKVSVFRQWTYTLENVPASPQLPTHLFDKFGDKQSAGPGQCLPNTLKVRVFDNDYNPLQGVRVNFLQPPALIMDPRYADTDENGYAETTVCVRETASLNTSHKFTVYTDEASAMFTVYVEKGTPRPSVQPPSTPIQPPPTPIQPLSTPRLPQSTGYVVWVEEVNGQCTSGVIHSDFVFINADDKTITFTGADGNVDPGDMIRAYIKVETGYTYERASERAPDILSECDD